MAKILIIDDKAQFRQMLAEELAFRGYTVITLGDRRSIQKEVLLSDPDLILFDPYLGGMHRWDLLETIKNQDPFVPVLIVTDYGRYRRDARVCLADGILIKSCGLKTLIRKIEEMLNGKGNQYMLPLEEKGGIFQNHGESATSYFFRHKVNGNSIQ